tara:strand:- start:164 stop:1129 length:966 start_codon:yes stop_codon:yes gene_type:complete
LTVLALLEKKYGFRIGMVEEIWLGSDCSLRPYIATRFREETTMVSHLMTDGGDFLPPFNELIETSKTQAERAVGIMLYFKETNCVEAKDWLLEHYMHTFVRSTARRLASGLPKSIEADDLEQVGYFGLVDCIQKYNPSLMYKFETFARQRVEGSMRDHLRKEDPASRLARSRTKMIARGISEFNAQFGRKPTDKELQNVLGLEDKEFASVMRDVHVPNTIPFHPTGEDDGGDGLGAISIELKCSGHEDVDNRDLHDWLCGTLGTYDKLIVVLMYKEGLTMLEIGHTIGYSESRVSQRLKHIHAVLKSKLSDVGCGEWLRAG